MIKLLGDPVLRKQSESVTDIKDEVFINEMELLKAELNKFRSENSFGRAISAPQIGISKRFIALNIDERGTFCIINPEITYQSDECFTMWDDCMSFPWLMVKVKRNKTINIKYLDTEGQSHEWVDIPQNFSELLQHEIDHLDGVVSLDRKIDNFSIIARQV